MHIQGISGIGAAASPAQQATSGVSGADGGFGDVLEGLAAVEADASGAITDLAIGGDIDLHEAVLAVEMESIAFDLAIQVRNRLVEAYQEIFRMTV